MSSAIRSLAAGAVAPAVVKAPSAAPAGLVARAQAAATAAFASLGKLLSRSVGFAKAHPFMAAGAVALTVAAFLKYCPRGQALWAKVSNKCCPSKAPTSKDAEVNKV